MLDGSISLPTSFQGENQPSNAPDFDAEWTFDAVEDRLIEAMRFAWRDEPGNWPFASDGPWHLIRSNEYFWDYTTQTGRLRREDEPPPPRVPLSREERARMAQAVDWLAMLDDPAVHPVRARVAGGACDARLVVLATRKLAAQRGEGPNGERKRAIRWSQLLRPMGLTRGAGMLSKRYSRAVAAIAVELCRRAVPVDLARG